MGQNLQKIGEGLFGFQQKEARILMLGLDASGKTTTLYQLKLKEVVTTIPTIGFNVETVKHNKVKCTIWDVGGNVKIRPLWRHYYMNTTGLIFVVDSSDVQRLEEAGEQLHKILKDQQLIDVPVLLLANKNDLPNKRSVSEIAQKLKLHTIRKREWFIVGTCAATGQGIEEGLDWMVGTLKNKNKKKKQKSSAQ